MSVGTIVTIVLLMSVLVLGIFLVQNIFRGATGAIDSEIYAGVSLLPASSDSSILVAEKIIVPIQIQVGSNDGMVSRNRVLPYYFDFISNTPIKEYLSIEGANHMGFLDEFFAKIAELLGMRDFSPT